MTGVPRYDAQFDVGNFIVAPTPDQDYGVEVQYLFRPASLTSGAGTDTTWLSDNADLAMLYGSLVEAYIFMKGEADVLKMYSDRYSESLLRLKEFAEARENADAYRRGLPQRPRT